MQYCQERGDLVGAVFIYKIERFSRAGAISYESLRMELEKHRIQLLDAEGIIQAAQNEFEDLGFSYEWSHYRPSSVNEMLRAEQGRDEVRSILTRTIGAQIRLAQRGHWNRQAPYGYTTTKVVDEAGKKRTTLEPFEKEAHHIREMFRLRALGMDDKAICNRLNDQLGYRSRTTYRHDPETNKIIGTRDGTKLTPKRLQEKVQRLSYCGVLCEKWTHGQPIKAAWDGLVDYDTFNAANRGKILVEERDGAILVSHSRIKQRKQSYHPHFIFKGLIRCPKCKKPFWVSTSNKQRKTPTAYYHCSRGHKYIGHRKEDLENAVVAFLKQLKLSPEISSLLQRNLIDEWEGRLRNLTHRAIDSADEAILLKREKQDIVETMMALRNSPLALGELQFRLSKVQEKLTTATSKRNKLELAELSVERFLEYVSHYLEHLDELLIDNRIPENQRCLFYLLFEQLPTYEEITTRTARLTLAFQYIRQFQKKKSAMAGLDDSSWNKLIESLCSWESTLIRVLGREV